MLKRRFVGYAGFLLLILGVWRSSIQNLCSLRLAEQGAYFVPSSSFALSGGVGSNNDGGAVPVSNWKTKILQNDLVASWQCDRHEALRAFNFTDFPLHSIPARGSLVRCFLALGAV